MIEITRKEDCCGCHACMNICPTQSIAMIADNEGFLYPQVRLDTCTNCGLCETVCPMDMPIPPSEPPAAYAAWNNDEAVRTDSSSGGVFDTLMRSTLKQGGVVFGAAFDDNLTLIHQYAENTEECHKFRGSKYLQSIVGDVYQKVSDYLAQGRNVLFSGTPCQVAGLTAFLGNNYDNLLTCDVVCHGVPSPKVFAAYRQTLELKHGAKTRRIAFRRKDCGWKRYSVSLSFDNDTEYRRVLSQDPFMIGFLANTYLRPSCHTCRFSRLPRVGDISLGDFWGVGRHHPEWDDDRGTSLILVQTGKGQKAFDECRGSLVVHEADLNLAIQSNRCICGSVAPGKNRELFFKDFQLYPFEKVLRKYMLPPTLWQRAIGKVKRVVGPGLRRMRLM